MGTPGDQLDGLELDPERRLSRVLASISINANSKLRPLYEAPPAPPARLQRQLTGYVQDLDANIADREFIDADLARQLAGECEVLLDLLDGGASESTHRLVQMAVGYFLDPDDAESDAASPIGFDDDAEVIRAVARELGVSLGKDE